MEISGKKVVDGAKKIILAIGPTDIKNGDTKDPASCAAAQACMRQLGVAEARVHIGRVYVKKGNVWVRFKTSKALRTEIIAFDRGGSFAPGEYTLEVMQPSKRKGKRQGGAVSRKTGNKRKQAYHTVAGVRAHGANR